MIIALGECPGSPKATSRHSSALHRLFEKSLLNFALGLHVQNQNIGYMVTKMPDVDMSALEFSFVLSLFLAHRILRYSRKMSLENHKLRGLSPRANYTDKAAAAGRRS